MRVLTSITVILGLIACDRPHRQPASSVTVTLPPARPYAPRPGFSFDKDSARVTPHEPRSARPQV